MYLLSNVASLLPFTTVTSRNVTENKPNRPLVVTEKRQVNFQGFIYAILGFTETSMHICI